MHICTDEIQVLLLVINDGKEHIVKYVEALFAYAKVRFWDSE